MIKNLISIETLNRIKKSKIKFLISSFEELSFESKQSSKTFIDLLPSNYYLPKIQSDEESLIYIWEDPQFPHMLIVDGLFLHFIENVATPNSIHYLDIPFNGIIPSFILKILPKYD